MSVSQPQWDLGLCADKMATVALGLLCVAGMVTATPVKTYDQRQHGELNIHAQFDNIVVLLIPSSKINLMDVSPEAEHNLTQVKPDKNAFLEFLQNHIKNDIDRYDVQQPATPQDENEVLTSQHVSLGHEEEVVATVEEMKPDKESPEKTTVPTKPETTESSPVKEEVKDTTVSESVQETFFKISIPVEVKDAVKKAEDKVKTDKENKKEEKEPQKVAEKVEKVTNEAAKPQAVNDLVSTKKEQQPLEKKEEISVAKVSAGSGSALDALIKPVAARSSEGAVTGVRREKVIRYKPESKWAPGLVDVLGPARQERQRFGPLCAPGLWDPELKTCIMPGETRR